MYYDVLSYHMLTENRREYLKKRGKSDNEKRVEYDYRVLKWLEAMLDSGEKGGIGDINRVLDTLDREAVHKHLKDENVYNLLRLVIRLLDILNFSPIEQTSRGQAIVASKTGIRRANDVDVDRNISMYLFANYLKEYYATGTVRQIDGLVLVHAMEIATRLGHETPSKEIIEKLKKDYNLNNEPQEGSGAAY
jgi:hypothetical protein